MRSADATTLIRVLLVIFVAYLIIYKFNPFVIAVLIAIAILLDAVDGFFAVHEASSGRITLGVYLSGLLGNERSKKAVGSVKKTYNNSAYICLYIILICTVSNQIWMRGAWS